MLHLLINLFAKDNSYSKGEKYGIANYTHFVSVDFKPTFSPRVIWIVENPVHCRYRFHSSPKARIYIIGIRFIPHKSHTGIFGAYRSFWIGTLTEMLSASGEFESCMWCDIDKIPGLSVKMGVPAQKYAALDSHDCISPASESTNYYSGFK